jgi:DnaK suppressor protein
MKKQIKAKRKTATKKAAMAKPKKVVKKSAPAKKASKAPAKKAAKPVAKKPAAKAPAPKPKTKVVAKPVKKAVPAPKAPVKPIQKKDIQSKVAVGKKPAAAAPVAPAPQSKKSGATATPAKVAPAPIKVEPRVIETSQPEFVARNPHEELFTVDELEIFRTMLQQEKTKILQKAKKAVDEGDMLLDRNELVDEVDQASAMVEQNLTFRLLDRDRKLLTEIEHALAKIDTGDYGYCEGTGEAIPKRRLELRPWCRHSVKYKEKLERMKKSGRGVADEDEI